MNALFLLFIVGVLQGSHSQTVYVSQISAVTTTEGSSVTLQCNYTLSEGEMAIKGWLKWYRHFLNGPEVSDKNPDFKGRVERTSQSDFFNKRSANIVLHRVEPTDTGMYICNVAFSLEKSAYGNGTFLNVTGSHSQTVYVSQISAVTTTEGSSVTLQCNYTLSEGEMASTGWFKWTS
ncbi:natural cytotoxicity triggering receptor 3 [Bombina bombina]|uniref:natural cytotoxicity triggering receptor 3 n=1 Tax=Bombina bombina TaxID=8345 RepID=UPI00235A57F0|nr:natural cytotoxicity triggering receptor 3 [Bombina bombina]